MKLFSNWVFKWTKQQLLWHSCLTSLAAMLSINYSRECLLRLVGLEPQNVNSISQYIKASSAGYLVCNISKIIEIMPRVKDGPTCQTLNSVWKSSSDLLNYWIKCHNELQDRSFGNVAKKLTRWRGLRWATKGSRGCLVNSHQTISHQSQLTPFLVNSP